jgi:hypothetical protein
MYIFLVQVAAQNERGASPQDSVAPCLVWSEVQVTRADSSLIHDPIIPAKVEIALAGTGIQGIANWTPAPGFREDRRRECDGA